MSGEEGGEEETGTRKPRVTWVSDTWAMDGQSFPGKGGDLEGYVRLPVSGARPGQRPGLSLLDTPQLPWGSEPHLVGLRMWQF